MSNSSFKAVLAELPSRVCDRCGRGLTDRLQRLQCVRPGEEIIEQTARRVGGGPVVNRRVVRELIWQAGEGAIEGPGCASGC